MECWKMKKHLDLFEMYFQNHGPLSVHALYMWGFFYEKTELMDDGN